MKFLLVDDEPLIRHFCIVILENYFDAKEIIECKNSLEAIEQVKTHDDISLIICDQEMPGGNGNLLIEYLVTVKSEIPFIFHTSRDIEDFSDINTLFNQQQSYSYVQKPCRITPFKEAIKAVLSTFSKEDVKYRRVRITYFLRYNKALCDIYIRVNDNKYLKLIHAHESYQKSSIDKYVDKNLKYLYVKDSDLEGFTTKYSTTPFLQFIEEDDNSNVEDSLVRIHAVLKDLLHSVGVDENVPKLAQAYFEKIDQLSSNNEEVSKLLFKLRKRNDYIYDHSYMTACLCSFILKRLEWGTVRVIEKLCYASLLHDVMITDPEIAMIHDLDSSKMRSFSKDEVNRYKNHGRDAVELIKNESFFGPDIEYILLTHHEKCDGSGFPGGVNGRSLRPMSCVFILCHEFVRLMYMKNFDEHSHKEVLTYLFNNYNSGNFKEILDVLYSTLELNPIKEDL